VAGPVAFVGREPELSVLLFGTDRVLFSVDYPFAPNALGRAVLDSLPLSSADKTKVAGLNAARLLGL